MLLVELHQRDMLIIQGITASAVNRAIIRLLIGMVPFLITLVQEVHVLVATMEAEQLRLPQLQEHLLKHLLIILKMVAQVLLTAVHATITLQLG
jgi:hypothetical protein